MLMRWLFIGIVVLNGLYFGWALSTRDHPPANPDAEAYSIGGQYAVELKLLDPAAPLQVAGPAAQIRPPAAGCPAVGPISDENVAEEVSQALAGQGIASSSVRLEGEPVPVYWVYLAPLEGRQQALRKLRELHAAGVESFIVSEGADANAISLGSFGVRDSAIGLQARLRTSGYPAQVREQLRAVSRFWVVLNDPAAQGFMEFIPRSLQATLRIERKRCPKGL